MFGRKRLRSVNEIRNEVVNAILNRRQLVPILTKILRNSQSASRCMMVNIRHHGQKAMICTGCPQMKQHSCKLSPTNILIYRSADGKRTTRFNLGEACSQQVREILNHWKLNYKEQAIGPGSIDEESPVIAPVSPLEWLPPSLIIQKKITPPRKFRRLNSGKHIIVNSTIIDDVVRVAVVHTKETSVQPAIIKPAAIQPVIIKPAAIQPAIIKPTAVKYTTNPFSGYRDIMLDGKITRVGAIILHAGYPHDIQYLMRELNSSNKYTGRNVWVTSTQLRGHKLTAANIAEAKYWHDYATPRTVLCDIYCECKLCR